MLVTSINMQSWSCCKRLPASCFICGLLATESLHILQALSCIHKLSTTRKIILLECIQPPMYQHVVILHSLVSSTLLFLPDLHLTLEQGVKVDNPFMSGLVEVQRWHASTWRKLFNDHHRECNITRKWKPERCWVFLLSLHCIPFPHDPRVQSQECTHGNCEMIAGCCSAHITLDGRRARFSSSQTFRPIRWLRATTIFTGRAWAWTLMNELLLSQDSWAPPHSFPPLSIVHNFWSGSHEASLTSRPPFCTVCFIVVDLLSLKTKTLWWRCWWRQLPFMK